MYGVFGITSSRVPWTRPGAPRFLVLGKQLLDAIEGMQGEARYDSGAMLRSIYEMLKRLRAEVIKRTAERE